MPPADTPAAGTGPDAANPGRYVTEGQGFVRDTKYIETRITADGRDGYPVEAGRYRLVAARACPWAPPSRPTPMTRWPTRKSAMA